MVSPRVISFQAWKAGGRNPFFLIAGPCVIESEDHCMQMATRLKAITSSLGIPFIFKASYDKANRTSVGSYRGTLVGDLMHTGNEVPKVQTSTPMDEVIHEISRMALGIVCVVGEQDVLVGVISDGDLRRLLQHRRAALLEQTALECMTPAPVTVGSGELAVKALHLMEQKKITALVVPDEAGRVIGIIHLHDLWGTEMF